MVSQSIFGGRRFIAAPATREYPQLPTISIRELNQFFFILAEPSSKKTESVFWLTPGEYQIRDGDVTGKFEFQATGKTEAILTFKFGGPDFAVPPLMGVAVHELEWVSESDSTHLQPTVVSSESLCLKPKKTEDGDFIFETGRGFIPTPSMNFTELNPLTLESYTHGALLLRARGDMVFGMCAPVRMYVLHVSGLEGFEHVRDPSPISDI
ncbi:hypothetical protein HYFRA_00003703 [Hymenoscyphus fraxineus]|uniref:Uncharacterized protein n=1 Tax=Hymenoscyphus fraxineus TaxID=746836 RepID=A0A9N9L191_9HELO|nr:hypothetical protein HYFRA_00003703 [Hymenoscyphus fraxineus]